MEELIERKAEKYGMSRDDALRDIIRSSSESRTSVNDTLGVDPNNPKLPPVEEVEARMRPPELADPVGELGAGSKALRIAGRAAIPLAIAFEAYDGYTQVQAGTESVPEAVGTGVGAVSGMVAGAEFGATAGAIGGPVGVAVGGLLGGLIGGVGGGAFGNEIGSWFD